MIASSKVGHVVDASSPEMERAREHFSHLLVLTRLECDGGWVCLENLMGFHPVKKHPKGEIRSRNPDR